MKKRIVGGVVIMHPNHNNYGTSLQGFATVKILQKLDYPFRIIRYKKRRSLSEILKTAPGLMKSGAFGELRTQLFKRLDKILHKEYAKNIKIRTNIINEFKAKYFDAISDYYKGYPNLCKGSKKYDVIFVGSDQVWGPLSLYSKFYNLFFVDKAVPQFSYASSFGVSNIFPWQLNGTKAYLDKMDAIGVREIRGKEIVDSLSFNKAKVVVDPTMLLSKDEWEQAMVASSYNMDEPYLFSYILGPRKDIRKEIMELGRKTGLKVISFNHTDWYESADENFGDIPIYNANPLDFIKLLRNAAYVCTDSFHGTVFSIIFHKKFLTFYRQQPTSSKSTHSRIDSLLGTFHLQERLCKNDPFNQIVRPIDYKNVDIILDRLRKDSMDFLKDSLELEKSK